MSQTKELDAARDHLARAEAAYASADGLAHLEHALALLDDLDEQLARNLEATYAGRIIARIAASVAGDPAMPEPELEHLFRMVLAFDESRSAPPPEARALKIRIARRLIDYYYEGSPPEEKERAAAELMQLAGARPQSHGRRR